ncbi:hypothetical protein ACFQML_20020 [Salinirubellus salinus]|uniref:hypothetical protein n=1 Tax=Salinirubellus salinus TaxID=1364945 RepID=UPI0036189B0F
MPALRAWALAQALSRIDLGTVRLEEGEYEAARELFGDEYDSTLERYVEITDVTRDRSDDRVAETLDRTAEEQDEFVDAVSDYQRTLDEYREARAEGEDERADRLARELNSTAERVVREGGDLAEVYQAVGRVTDTDLSPSIRRIGNVTDRVSEERTAVIRSEFDPTLLQASVTSESASFVNPLNLSGQLATSNGTSVSNATVRVRLGNETLTVRTTRNGTFDVSIRPVLVDVGRQVVSVRYRPREASPYLGSTTNVTVVVEQVRPQMSVDPVSSNVSFGEPVRVSGRVAVDNVTVGGLPVTVTVGDTELGRVRTAENGSFAVSDPLPARVPAGTQSLSINVSTERAAVGAVETVRTVTVEETGTDLTTSAGFDSGNLVVDGRLQTSEGRAVGGQTVRILVNGTGVESVRTNGSGAYDVTLEPRSGLVERQARTLNVTAVYDGTATNLVGDRASTTVSLPESRDIASVSDLLDIDTGIGSMNPFFGVSVPSTFVGRLVVALSLVAFAGLVLYEYRRRSGRQPSPEGQRVSSLETDDAESVEGDEGGGGGSAGIPSPPAVSETEGPRQPAPSFAEAHERLRAGETDEAVVAAYFQARSELTERLLPEVSGTPRQFLVACEGTDLAEERVAALRRLVDSYERAAFGLRPVDHEVAQSAIRDAVVASSPSET